MGLKDTRDCCMLGEEPDDQALEEGEALEVVDYTETNSFSEGTLMSNIVSTNTITVTMQCLILQLDLINF